MQPGGPRSSNSQGPSGDGGKPQDAARSASARRPSLPPPPSAAPRFDQSLPALPSLPPPSAAQQSLAPASPFPQLGAGSPADAPTPERPAAAAQPASTLAPAPGGPGQGSAPASAGASLGVRQAIRANTATKLPAILPSQPPADDAVSGREPTLSARIRSVQPPDVARQAISELGVLARELATLPAQLD